MIHEILISPEQRKAIRIRAAEAETTSGALMEAALYDFVHDGLPEGATDVEAGTATFRLRFSGDDKLWLKGRAKALELGISLSAAIRMTVASRLSERA